MNFRILDADTKRTRLLTYFILAGGYLFLVFNVLRWWNFRIPLFIKQSLQTVNTIFLSILFEALPFILIGVFVSAVIQVFVSEETVARLVPRHRLVGIMAASLMGLIFPVCECGIVPVVRRLTAKGMPIGMGISFLLAVPIINPVVMASTYFAFNDIKMVIYRVSLAFIVSLIVAFVVNHLTTKNPSKADNHIHYHVHDHSCSCGCGHIHDHYHKVGLRQKIYDTLLHASDEFFQMGKYLIIGASLTAIIQVFVPRQVILDIGQGPVTSTLTMMGLGYLLSLCSEADAFIAATFTGSFTISSILAFLVFGPMLDVKNTLMLLGAFRLGFVLKLIVAVSITVFFFSIGIYLVL